MERERRSIHWALPAIHDFIRTFNPETSDLNYINSLLRDICEHPHLHQLTLINKASIPQLNHVEGDVFVTEADWVVYFNWRKEEIYVVHVTRLDR